MRMSPTKESVACLLDDVQEVANVKSLSPACALEKTAKAIRPNVSANFFSIKQFQVESR